MKPAFEFDEGLGFVVGGLLGRGGWRLGLALPQPVLELAEWVVW
jgi:hypothetical protein